MNNVIILRGIPGAGKSTWVLKNVPLTATVCSADHFFTDKDGQYRFDPSKLPDAHGACLKKYTKYVTMEFPHAIVVDNTNTTAIEIAPYAALALAHGRTLSIVTLRCPADVGASRNVHGAPLSTVQAMAQRLVDQEKFFPPWWAHEVVEWESK
jgi:predicted kinase